MSLVCALSVFACLAQETSTKSSEEEYQTRVVKINQALADEHCALGAFLSGAQQHEWARVEYRNAIRFVATHEKANKAMGFTVWNDEAKVWESDPSAPPPPSGNKKKGDEQDKIWAEYQKKVEAMGKKVAKLYYELGAWCKKNLTTDPEKAREAFKRAIEYDPVNKEARTALGHKKQPSGAYISPEEEKSRAELKSGVAKAPKGTKDATATEVEQKLGITCTKMVTEHLLIESPHLDQKTLEGLMQHAEHAYLMFEKIFNQSNLFGQRQTITILQSKAQHEKYVDVFAVNAQPEFKKLAKDSIGMGPETWQGDRPIGSLEDFCIHQTIMMCSEHMAGGDRHWIHEGLAYYFTKFMHDTTGTHCTDMRGTGPGESGKHYEDGSTWPIVICEWLKTGKGEPSIEEVFKCVKLSELRGGEPVKAWSLVEFLTTEHREKFIDFMQKVRAVKREEDEKTFQEVFGWTLRELDDRWKVYARGTYMEGKK